jgi:hypothetical protein
MTALNLNLAQSPLFARETSSAPVVPPALREFLSEAVQVVKGGLVRTASATDLDPALRRDLGLD